MTILHIAEHLARTYPLVIVFDPSIPDGIVRVDQKAAEIRVAPNAARVRPQGSAGWANFPKATREDICAQAE
jgi:hypothetical protein